MESEAQHGEASGLPALASRVHPRSDMLGWTARWLFALSCPELGSTFKHSRVTIKVLWKEDL